MAAGRLPSRRHAGVAAGSLKRFGRGAEHESDVFAVAVMRGANVTIEGCDR